MNIGHNSGSGVAVITPDEDSGTVFHYISLHIGDWLGGTVGMTPEQEGAYFRFLAHLYQRGKPLPDDDRFMARAMSLSLRVWKRLKDDLVALGKIILRGGCLTNNRFEKERQKRGEEMRKRSEAAQKRWAKSREVSPEFAPSLPETSAKLPENVEKKPNEINENSIQVDMLSNIQYPISNIRKDISPYGDLSSGQLVLAPNDDKPKPMASVAVREAFALYNETAQRCDLPLARTLSPARMRALALRVKEAGGLDGFKQAMTNLEKSAWLQGRNASNWKADLDFVCQAKSFTRLFEGGYGNGANAERPASVEKYQQTYRNVR